MGGHDPDLLRRIRAANADPSVPEADYDNAVDVLYHTEELSQNQLLAAIQNIQANRIALVLDTCYSATVADQDSVLRRDVNATVTNRIGHASGRFVHSGSFAGAYDSTNGSDSPTETDGHGLFTSVLLRALRGEADTDRSGRIDIYKLATFTKHMSSKKAPSCQRSGSRLIISPATTSSPCIEATDQITIVGEAVGADD